MRNKQGPQPENLMVEATQTHADLPSSTQRNYPLPHLPVASGHPAGDVVP